MYKRYKSEEFTFKQITYLLIFVPTMDSGTLKQYFEIINKKFGTFWK